MLTDIARITGRIGLALAALTSVLLVVDAALTATVDDDPARPRAGDLPGLLSAPGSVAVVLGLLVPAVVALRVRTGRSAQPLFLAVAVGGAALVQWLVAVISDRELGQRTGAAVALFAGGALLVSWYVGRGPAKAVSITLLTGVPLVVAYGELAGGGHRPTDVALGAVNGAVCLAVAARHVLGRRLWGARGLDPSRLPTGRAVRAG